MPVVRFLVLLLLSSCDHCGSTAYSGQVLDNALIHVIQSGSVTVVVEINFHQCPRISRKSLKYIHKQLLLKQWRTPFFQDGQIHFFQEHLKFLFQHDSHVFQ